jgi:hypothetical protein
MRFSLLMPRQASFFWNSSQARARMSATKMAKIPPEAYRLKKS